MGGLHSMSKVSDDFGCLDANLAPTVVCVRVAVSVFHGAYKAQGETTVDHSAGDKKMSVIAIEEAARKWATELEAKEARRSGVSIRLARKTVAKRMNLAPGTLENLKNRRLKGVRVYVFERIRAAFMREAEAEIARLEHGLEVARQIGMDARAGEVREMEADIAALYEAAE
jgi:hypothetical protein